MQSADGVPIYIRITIDGSSAETSLGKRIPYDDWDIKRKCSKRKDDHARSVNAAITKARADLERHFTVLEAQHPIVTAEMLKQAYQSSKTEKVPKKDAEAETFLLSNLIDDFTKQYFVIEKAQKRITRIKNKEIQQLRLTDVECLKQTLSKKVDEAMKRANELLDDKQYIKSLLNAVDYQLLSFLQKVLNNLRSGATLKKWAGTKNKLKSFIYHRYKKIDFPLPEIEFSFAEHFYSYLTIKCHCKNNAAMKYIKNTKQIFDFSVMQPGSHEIPSKHLNAHITNLKKSCRV